MGMNWLPRSVSFAESIAIGPKTCSSQRAYASGSLSIVANVQIDVYHSIRMIATALAPVVANPHKISIGNRNLEEALDHGCHLLRYLELMKVACADGHADVDVRFERK
jgi:hypothetical protein